MKTIKDYTSFVNENVKIQESVDVELDQDVIDYYLEIAESGALSREEAINQVANDFGISDEAVSIIIDAAGIKESVEVEEEEEEEVIEEETDEEINEASDEDEYLSAKQKKLPEALKKGIIAKNKKAGKKAGDKKEDKDDKDDKKDDKKEDKEDKKDESGKSDEDKYLSAKQKKLPEGLKKAIIKKAKAKK